MNKLNVLALSLSLSAIAVTVFTPVYISYEENKALKYAATMSAKSQKDRLRSSKFSCDKNGIVWMTAYGSGIATSGAVSAVNTNGTNSYVLCDVNGYILNGKQITEHEIVGVAVKAGLTEKLVQEQTHKKRGSGIPRYDHSAFVNSVSQIDEK